MGAREREARLERFFERGRDKGVFAASIFKNDGNWFWNTAWFPRPGHSGWTDTKAQAVIRWLRARE